MQGKLCLPMLLIYLNCIPRWLILFERSHDKFHLSYCLIINLSIIHNWKKNRIQWIYGLNGFSITNIILFVHYIFLYFTFQYVFIYNILISINGAHLKNMVIIVSVFMLLYIVFLFHLIPYFETFKWTAIY